MIAVICDLEHFPEPCLQNVACLAPSAVRICIYAIICDDMQTGPV